MAKNERDLHNVAYPLPSLLDTQSVSSALFLRQLVADLGKTEKAQLSRYLKDPQFALYL